MKTSLCLARHFCAASGIRYYETPAHGPPLLLLHGVARNHSDWFPLLAGLRDSWQVILVDHLGHGLSSHPSAGAEPTRSASSSSLYTVAHYAEAISKWLANRPYRDVVVVGHSLGAMVGLALASTMQQQIAGAVLEDPPFHAMGCDIASGPYQMQFVGMKQVAALQRVSHEQRVEALGQVAVPTPTGVVPLSTLRDRESLSYSAECLSLVDPEIFRPLVECRWLDGFDADGYWRACRVPVLGLQGDSRAGGLWSDDDLARAQTLCPQLNVVRCERIGHQIHRSDPDGFLVLLNSFWQSLPW